MSLYNAWVCGYPETKLRDNANKRDTAQVIGVYLIQTTPLVRIINAALQFNKLFP